MSVEELSTSTTSSSVTSDTTVGVDGSDSLVNQKRSYDEVLERFARFKTREYDLRMEQVNRYRSQFGPYATSRGNVTYERFFTDAQRGVHAVRYSKNGRCVAMGFGNGAVRRLSRKERTLHEVEPGQIIGRPVTSIKYNRMCSNLFYAANASGTVTFCSVTYNRVETLLTERWNEIYTMEVDDESQTVLTAGKDAKIRTYDCATAKMKRLFTKAHEKRIYALKLDPEEHDVFYSGGWDNMLSMWDVRTLGGKVRSATGPHVVGECLDVRGRNMLVASWQEALGVQLWDTRSLQKIKEFDPINAEASRCGSFVYITQFLSGDSSGDLFLVGSMGGKSLDVCSFSANAVLHSFLTGGTVMAVDSYGRNIAFGGTGLAVHEATFLPDGSATARHHYLDEDESRPSLRPRLMSGPADVGIRDQSSVTTLDPAGWFDRETRFYENDETEIS